MPGCEKLAWSNAALAVTLTVALVALGQDYWPASWWGLWALAPLGILATRGAERRLMVVGLVVLAVPELARVWPTEAETKHRLAVAHLERLPSPAFRDARRSTANLRAQGAKFGVDVPIGPLRATVVSSVLVDERTWQVYGEDASVVRVWRDQAPAHVRVMLAEERVPTLPSGDETAFLFGNGEVVFASPIAGELRAWMQGASAGGRGPRFRWEVAGVRVVEATATMQPTLVQFDVDAGAQVRLVFDDDGTDTQGGDRNVYARSVRIDPG